MKTITRNTFAWATLAAVIAVGSLIAQDSDPIKQKTQILSEALKAREEGDLKTARDRYEALQKLDQADEGAKEGLAAVNAAISAAEATKSGTAVVAEPVAVKPTEPAKVVVAKEPAKSADLITTVETSHQNLYREVETAIAKAKESADQSNYKEALRILDGANGALPSNPTAQALRDEIALTRQDILGRREAGEQGTDAIARAEIDRIAKLNDVKISASTALVVEAENLIRDENYDAAKEKLDKAKQGLPNNIATAKLAARIKNDVAAIFSRRALLAIEAREMTKADGYIKDFENLKVDEAAAVALRAEFNDKKSDPTYRNIDDLSPGLRAKDQKIDELLVKGRARYLYGDYTGALDAYREVLQYQPNNAEAKAFQVRIRQFISENSGAWNRGVTKGKMFELLDESWKLPEVYNREVVGTSGKTDTDPTIDKLRSITVPEINIRDMPFDRAITQLINISQSYDKENKGVNMVVIDPDRKNPSVNMTLRNVSLEKAIDLITKQVNFTYTINQGILEIRPDSGSNDLETEFFPLSSAAETKMTGLNTGVSASTTGGAANPFGASSTTGSGSGDVNPRNEGIKNFLTRSGVSFEVQGAVLNYDGTTLIVTQNRKNLERIRNILRRYSDIKQVHIEAKFIEVSESSLNELSSNLRLSNANGVRAQTNLRSINDVYGSTSTSSNGQIVPSGGTPLPIPNLPPAFPTANYGGTSPNFGGPTAAANSGYAMGQIGTIGSYDLSIFLKAIEQNSGADLMSAPSLTVLDGKTAIVKIAQLLRYPQSYGDVQAQVSAASQTGGDAVAITAGTPQDFTVQDVGVTLEVTPTVGADDSIALNLKPKVVEFEGFVEYGGTSIAISGGTTVSVPSGFFQPIFTTREVTTDVTVFDGATVVIGGLTREEVKTVNDKVPVLGDIPLLGNAFRSNSKSTVKRNLTVFVTANLVSPGGATLRSNYPGMRAGSTFSNPVILSPGGAVYREPIEVNNAPAAPTAPAPAAQ
jgi:general secretion pathway protein D